MIRPVRGASTPRGLRTSAPIPAIVAVHARDPITAAIHADCHGLWVTSSMLVTFAPVGGEVIDV